VSRRNVGDFNGEYPAEIASRAAAFWNDVDAAATGVSSQ
jgi:hypothetical protein